MEVAVLPTSYLLLLKNLSKLISRRYMFVVVLHCCIFISYDRSLICYVFNVVCAVRLAICRIALVS